MARIEVRYDSGAHAQVVGQLVSVDHRIFFQYDAGFRQRGLELSPFRLRTNIVEPVEETDRVFGGLHGLFNDSLPDGWGMIVMDRALSAMGVDARRLTPLDRLAFIGTRGMGALTYHAPTDRHDDDQLDVDLTAVAEQAARVLEGSTEDLLPELVRAGGSPMGARPKIVAGVRADFGHLVTGTDILPPGYAHWLIKFTAREDSRDMGAIEMAYADMARAAGISMPPTHLFTSRDGRSYFGVERFDRDPLAPSTRLHIHTLSGLLHAPHTIPGQDYNDLLTATRDLTKHHEEVVEAFRRMVFNILAHNRDDHTKNFAYQMGQDGGWRLTPAYDVTISEGIHGQHTMMIAGEGLAPTRAHVAAVAENGSIATAAVREIIEAVEDTVGDWSRYAQQYEVTKVSISSVQQRLDAARDAFNTPGGASIAGRRRARRPRGRAS